MKIRAKFRVEHVTHVAWSPDARVVKLFAATNDGTPENERYHRYTPSGTLEITVDNPAVAKQFDDMLGKYVYLDFTPAE